MPFEFFENGINNFLTQLPDQAMRDRQQASINALWDVTTSRKTIKQQTDIGSKEYNDIEVWIGDVVGLTSRGMTNGDDFAQLSFKNLNQIVKKGLYYKFNDNTWITYFTDKHDSVDVSIGVRRCNNVLRIIDPENGSIFSIPCVIDYDMTSPSMQVTSNILTPNNHATVFVQGNEDTYRLFKLNSRYMLSGRPFKLLAYQNTIIDKTIANKSSYLALELYLDEMHAKDSIENQLAYNGDYNYQIMIDSDTINVTEDFVGTIDASVTLNGTEIKKNIVWESTNPTVAVIDKNGKYKVLGKQGENCTIVAKLDGNDDVKSSIELRVVDKINIQPKVIIEPSFDKIRQGETINFNILTNYNGKVYIPNNVKISLDKEKEVLSNKYIVLKKLKDGYSIFGNGISLKDINIYIQVENENPTFSTLKEFSIKAVNMLG